MEDGAFHFMVMEDQKREDFHKGLLKPISRGVDVRLDGASGKSNVQ